MTRFNHCGYWTRRVWHLPHRQTREQIHAEGGHELQLRAVFQGRQLGVIEVDGGFHDKPEQAARDALKNSILAKSGLPILRLRTVESGIEEKIAGFLATWAQRIADDGDAAADA